MSTAPRSRIPWHTIVIAAATVGLLWLFFRNINLAETWVAMTLAHVVYLADAVGATLSTYTLRAIRWQALLRPVGTTRLSVTFRATVIGFTAIFLLPGRIGEVLRAWQEAVNQPVRECLR